MKTINTFLLIFCAAGLVMISSCGSDDGGDLFFDSSIPVADLEADKSAIVGSTVTIGFPDSSLPDGIGNFTLKFISGPSSNGLTTIETPDGNTYSIGDQVLSTTDPNDQFSFIPGLNGVYSFELEAVSNNLFNTDVMNVTVTGAITLTNALLAELTSLEDVGQNGLDINAPDYIVEEILTLDGKSLVLDGTVTIQFGSGAGLVLTNSASIEGGAQFIGDGWKGILIESGWFDMRFGTISGAGGSAFDGYEAAAVTVVSGTIGLSSVDFDNNSGIEVNLLENASVNSSTLITSNTFDGSDVIHCDFFHMNNIYSNTYNASDALVTVTGEGETTIAAGSGSFRIGVGNVDYYFKGGVTFGQSVDIDLEDGKTIYVEEGTGLVFNTSANIQGTDVQGTITGWNSASWKGLLFGGYTVLEDVEINGAGSAPHTLSGSTTSAVYMSGSIGSIRNVTISDSESFGYYISNAATLSAFNNVENFTFTNNASAAVVVPIDEVHLVLGTNPAFTTPANVEAVRLLDATTLNSTTTTVPALPGSNFYGVHEDLTLFSTGARTLAFDAGVRIKFEPSTSIDLSNQVSLDINGTAMSPVIFEPSDAVSGWDGIKLNSSSVTSYTVEHLHINGGGANTFFGSTDRANIVLNVTHASSTISFTNCSIINSKAYGVLIEAFSETFDFEAGGNANAFSGNTSGNVNDKTI